MHDAHSAFPLVQIAIVIVIAVVAGLLLMRLRQPPLVGFILAGVVLGPTGFRLIENSDNVTALAEMGVLLLLFFIGTELSLKAFVATIRPALLVAGGQFLAAFAIGLGISALAGWSVTEGVILGFILALSSTVVAMKMLDEMGALRRTPGRITVGVMIAQDIGVVPMLILVSALGGGNVDVGSLTLKIVVAVGLLGGLLWFLGRTSKIRLPFDEQIGENVELLALGSLAFCFAAAAITGALGLSGAYGAFLAGLVIGNSSLRTRVIPVIEPIQSILLVIFFLSIGLLIDLTFIWENIWVVMAAALAVISIKTVLNVFLLRMTGFDRETALIGGLSMAQIGEFSFVLAATGLTAGALGYDIYRLAIAVTAITLLLSPAWIGLMRRVEEAASDNFGSYQEALSEAYSDEIDSVSNAWWWWRVRARAWRMAQHRRKEALAEQAESKSANMGETEPDAAAANPSQEDTATSQKGAAQRAKSKSKNTPAASG